MDIVIDTSALIAVIVDEPERDKIIELITGNALIGPGSIPWEIGNAFSAMYAYDAYLLDCALRQKAPILTLDLELKETAQNLKISTLEG